MTDLPDEAPATRSLADAIRSLDTVPLADVFAELEILESQRTDPNLVTYLRERYHAPHAMPSVQPGELIGGRYRIVRPLGRGGMGLVYVAEQTHVNRRVALKMISPALASEGMVHRMAGEISSLGRLNHAHIVRVFDADVHHDGDSGRSSLYFTMEIVEGHTIDRWAGDTGGDTDALLACFAGVCDAVAFAHDRGVVHRDLKPANVMVRPDGTPAVLDFGIASVREANLERAAREAGAGGEGAPNLSGTPEYMSPSKWNRVDDLEAGDVFALGVILFELFAGRRPWRLSATPSLEEVRSCITGGAADRLRTVRPSVDPAVDALVHRMLAHDPATRPTARESRDAVRGILSRRRRRAWLAKWSPAIVTGVLVFTVASGVAARHLWLHTRHLASEAAFKDALVGIERPGIDPAAWIRAMVPPSPAVRHDNEAWRDLVIEAHAIWRLEPAPPVPLARGERLLASDPEAGRHLVRLADGRLALRDASGTTVAPPAFAAANASSEALVARLCPGRLPRAAARDGTGRLTVWDAASGEVRELGTFADGGEALGFSPDGSRLACGATVRAGSGTLGQLTIWEVGRWDAPQLLETRYDSGQPLDRQVECLSVEHLAWHLDGALLAAVGDDGRIVFVWERDADGGSWRLHSANYHPSPVGALAWNRSRHAPLLATGRRDGVVSVWERTPRADGRTMITTPVFEFTNSPGTTIEAAEAVAGLAWLPGGAEILAVGTAGTASAWAFRRPTAPVRRFSLGGQVEATTWHAATRELVIHHPATSSAAPIRWWRWHPGRAAADIYLPFETESLDFDHHATWLAAGGDKGLPVGAAVVDLARLEVATEWTQRLSGPVRFQPGTTRLWMFPRGKGLVSLAPHTWTRDMSETAPAPIASPKHASTGALAFTADAKLAVFSLGTSVYSLTPPAARPPRFTPAATLDEPVPLFELDSADRVTLALDPAGRWLAVTRGSPRRSTIHQSTGEGGWQPAPHLPEFRNAALAFDPATDTLLVYRPPELERRTLAANTLVGVFRADDTPPTSKDRPAHLVTATDGRATLVSSEGNEPSFLQRTTDREFVRIARLRRRHASHVRTVALAPDGSRAAIAADCWRGSLVTCWNLDAVADILEETDFDPVPLPPPSSTAAR